MKRSEINTIIHDADAFIGRHGFHLPPFAYWSPQDWEKKGKEVCEIVENKLGWDVTDFRLGDFGRNGLVLFTLRNGHPQNWGTMQGKLYAEKVMVIGVDQVAPLHFHWQKMEDIINRGGGQLWIQLYNSTAEDALADTDVTVSVDGEERVLPAGACLALSPGESITLPTRCYHRFWGAGDRVLIGEVSLVNDDDRDNRFYEPLPRFPEIEEDEPPLYLLCTDYSNYYRRLAGSASTPPGGRERG